jgi:isopenicillin N synthase-like dioxygenase
MREVPTIDVAALVQSAGAGAGGGADEAARAAVASAIRDAGSSLGFFYIANHGVSPQLIGEVLECTRAFYALPEARRAAVRAGAGRAQQISQCLPLHRVPLTS